LKEYLITRLGRIKKLYPEVKNYTIADYPSGGTFVRLIGHDDDVIASDVVITELQFTMFEKVLDQVLNYYKHKEANPYLSFKS
jgi:hypothetical protein